MQTIRLILLSTTVLWLVLAPNTVAFAQASTSASLIDQISQIETTLYGAPSTLPFHTRLARLEMALVGHPQGGSLHERVLRLEDVVNNGHQGDQPLQLSPSIERGIPTPFASPTGAEPAATPGSASPAADSGQSVSGAPAEGTTAKNGSSNTPAPATVQDPTKLEAHIQQTDLGSEVNQQMPPSFPSQMPRQWQAPPAPPSPSAPPIVQVPVSRHARAKAIAHGIGVALNVTLRTAAMVAGTAAAAYVNSSVSYGGSYGFVRSAAFAIPHVDTCACPVSRGF